MGWGKAQIDRQVVSTAAEDYAAFEAVGLSEIEDARVLDAGCFDGVNTHAKFAPYANISEVIGIDPDADAVKRATSSIKDPRFTFIQCPIEDFSSNELFDIVYFSHVLQHVKDKALVCRKALSLLKPGGWIIVKTIDDSLKLSYPDSERIMKRLFELYEKHVLPNTEHTRYTDRYHGQKCLTQLQEVGFEDVSIKVFSTDTSEQTKNDRLALFERCVYFRRNVPEVVEPEISEEISSLVKQWGELFESDDYYFMSQSLVAVGRKPSGETFGQNSKRECIMTEAGTIRPMTEADLGEVMAIEIEAFPSPWTPVAYAMDLRHNPAARYDVVVDDDGAIVGYLGWWLLGERATIMHIASKRQNRRGGIGAALVQNAFERAANEGAGVMQLEVRESNAAARSFYEKLGFEDAGVIPEYYSNPTEDAVVMLRPLELPS